MAQQGPDEGSRMLVSAGLPVFLVARALALLLHEAAHALVAFALGYRRITFHASAFHLSVRVPSISGRASLIVRHAGWVVSVGLLAVVALASSTLAVVAAFGYTALEAICSDLLRLTAPKSACQFYCGNFGLIMLHTLHRKHVLPILRLMARTTMVRGAQSAGIVTYRPIPGRSSKSVHVAQRVRKVNGKRTDLADMLLGKEGTAPSNAFFAAREGGTQIFSGHTRFATSSHATLDGCHPHRWSPGVWMHVWHYSAAANTFEPTQACVEAYITHNGDLDYFSLHEHEYALGELQTMLPHILRKPLPGLTDSCCLAGLFELLRTQGTWLPSVRYAMIYGALNLPIAGAFIRQPEHLWTARQQLDLGAFFEDVWRQVVADHEEAERRGAAASAARSKRVGDLPPGTCGRSVRRLSVASVKPVGSPSAHSPGSSFKKRLQQSSLSPRQSFGWEQAEADVRRHQATVVAEEAAASSEGRLGSSLGDIMVRRVLERMDTLRTKLDLATTATKACGHVLSQSEVEALEKRFVEVCVSAFLTNDLMMAGRDLLKGAKGSFGVVLSHTLDCAHSTLIAARGQTMSVAFYPKVGMVLFGSEQAATKAAMGLHAVGDAAERPAQPAAGWAPGRWRRHRVSKDELDEMDASKSGEAFNYHTSQLKGSFRLDLDDLGGEIVVLTWGSGSAADAKALDAGQPRPMLQTSAYLERRLWRGTDGVDCEATSHVIDTPECRCDVISLLESKHKIRKPFIQRVLRLDGNELVQPLLPLRRDPVGTDIQDIPRVLERLKADFSDASQSHNLSPAWNFSYRLLDRIRLKETGKHDGSVDLLVTGCEVSLWAGEQFASDLHLCFPSLKVVTLSSNKLLALLGQGFSIPQEGFQFNGSTHSFKDSVVLLISSTGGTFATLGVSNLLKAVTSELFTVTSEWDTQVARSVREQRSAKKAHLFAAYNFSTFAGFRPAEPSTVSLVATHSLLTHVLLFMMNHHGASKMGGSTYEIQEVQELNSFHEHHIKAVRAIIGVDQNGGRAATEANSSLRRQGRRWAQHVLEGPMSWILSALYIAVTVIAGDTPLSLIVSAVTSSRVGLEANATAAEPDPIAVAGHYVRATVDALLYIFLPIWTTWLLRLVQRRHLLHRVAGRSILIGDIPWVAQSVEAYVSKLFALSYSIASISVASGNAVDHLVHRFTHRVVRGSLLAVGRPDARLNALTSADSATCLSISQACAIVNLTANCEAVTIGHHANKLQMVEACLVLPTIRPKFLCELLLEKDTSPLKAMRSDFGGSIDNKQANGEKSFMRRKPSNVDTSNHSNHSDGGGRKGGRLFQRSNSQTSLNPIDHLNDMYSAKSFEGEVLGGSVHGGSAGSSTHDGSAGGSTHDGSPGGSTDDGGSGGRAHNGSTHAGSNASAGNHSFSPFRRRKSDDSMNGSNHAQVVRDPSPATPGLAHPNKRLVRRFSNQQHPMALMGKLNALKSGDQALPERLATQDTGGEMKGVRARMRISSISESFIGAWMQHSRRHRDLTTAQMCDRQRDLQQLYETRFASLQRLIGFFVMFHEMGKTVQDFWPMVSCGLLGYDMSRSQSMLRVATTASPISGSEVRERILELEEEEMRKWAARTIQRAARFVQMIQKHHRSKAQDTIFSQAIANSGASNATTTTDTILAAEMISALPDHYLWSTTVDERQTHLELYRAYKSVAAKTGVKPMEKVLVRYTHHETHVQLCLVFHDTVGSLSNITACLTARGVNIVRVAAFCTRGGVAVNTFQLSKNFDGGTADLVRMRLAQSISESVSDMDASSRDLVDELPEHYMHSTDLVERQAHAELYAKFTRASNNKDGKSRTSVLTSWCKTPGSRGEERVALYLVFRDVLGSLAIIMDTLKSCSVNINHVAAFCTRGGVAVDTFSLSANFTDAVATALVNRLTNEIAMHDEKENWASATLISDLPEYYLGSTSQRERKVHRSLHEQYRSGEGPVVVSWSNKEGSRSVDLYLVFPDVVGSLSTITTVLLEGGVNILRVAAFVTRRGVCIDSFEVTAFSDEVAAQLKTRLEERIAEGQNWMQKAGSALMKSLAGQHTPPRHPNLEA